MGSWGKSEGMRWVLRSWFRKMWQWMARESRKREDLKEALVCM